MRDHAEPPQEGLAPPHNIEAEQALLGALLIQNNVFDRVGGTLDEGHFYEPLHGRIYAAAVALIQKGGEATPVTLRAHFLNDPAMQDVGGVGYLARLTGAAVSIISSPDYARVIRDLADRRRLIEACSAAGAHLADAATPVEDALSPLETALLAPSGDEARKPVSATRIGRDMLDALTEAYQTGERRRGVTTGIAALDEVTGGLWPGQLVIVGGRPGMGKAQPLDARILTDRGWTTMRDVRVGDEIASVDGGRSMVSGVFERGERAVYRVTFSDGRSTRACGDHLWSVGSSRFDGARVLTTDEIALKLRQERFQRRLYVPLHDGVWGKEIEAPVSPWLLGVLLGDGCLKGATPSVSIADAAILWRVQAEIGDGVGLRASGDYDYRISGMGGLNVLTQRLRSLGLMGAGSREKFIPPTYMAASRAQRLDLLRGLMDTDGWVEAHGSVRFSTGSPQLARDVCELVRSLGGVCSTREHASAYTKGDTRVSCAQHFTLNIRHRDTASLFTLARKARRCRRVSPPKLTIVSVEPDGVEPVRCISVTHPSRLYVTDHHVVTHNSALSLYMAWAIAQSGRGVLFASLEMAQDEIAVRLASLEVWRRDPQRWIPYSRIRQGDIQREDDFRAIVYATQAFQRAPLVITPPTLRDIGGLSAAARAAKRRWQDSETPLGAVFVDYLGKVAPPRDLRSRVQEVGEVTGAMKQLAQALGAPVVLCAQLNRGNEHRGEDKRPNLSDLRDSGEIEQDADVVLLPYREEYYLARNEALKSDQPDEWHRRMEEVRNITEIAVAKQRQGAVANVRVFGAMGINAYGDPPR